MADTRLRELERRWRESLSADDLAPYLLERVRVGELTLERLELAAYCGDEGARRAAGVPPPTDDLSQWTYGLVVHGPVDRVAARILVEAVAVRLHTSAALGSVGWEPLIDLARDPQSSSACWEQAAGLMRQFDRRLNRGSHGSESERWLVYAAKWIAEIFSRERPHDGAFDSIAAAVECVIEAGLPGLDAAGVRATLEQGLAREALWPEAR